MSSEDINILLVEDDEVDAEAVVRALQRLNVKNPLTIVTDGLEALNVLRGEAGRAPLPRPYIILLDLNMPRMNGIEFLDALRQDPQLKRSVVFVLTTSNRPADKIATYDRHVAGYLVKSRTGADFSELIMLLDWYQRVVEFPPS
ncbi:MAG TPA: response regulator [Anaerolineae bacterium]|nr:response regulator [Anaerolineae bacterium]HMR64897.1 response regulator [Anaerolineae bacterium]